MRNKNKRIVVSFFLTVKRELLIMDLTERSDRRRSVPGNLEDL